MMVVVGVLIVGLIVWVLTVMADRNDDDCDC